jgi:hypothetical protein
VTELVRILLKIDQADTSDIAVTAMFAVDGLVYSSGHGTAVLETDSGLPVTIPEMEVFTRVTEGPERGKISVMTVYEDHTPLMRKLQAMAG